MKIVEFIRGSHLYGTNVESSDIDKGGIFMHTRDEYMGLLPLKEVDKDTKGDECYYDLKKFFLLACTANPNILDNFFIPDQFIISRTKHYDLIRESYPLFITKKCMHSFSGYAHAQISKAKGQNKKVHSVEKFLIPDEVALIRELYYNGVVTKEQISHRFNSDFLSYILKDLSDVQVSTNTLNYRYNNSKWSDFSFKMEKPKRESFLRFVHHDGMIADQFFGCMAFRPKTLEEYNLNTLDLSSVEGFVETYRVYENGSGVFDAQGKIKFTSISKEREFTDFIGVCQFNEAEYNKQIREWNSFWEWMSNRNENRWKDSDKGEKFEYDRKNMMHCIRLMMEAEHIALHGRPVVHWTGDDRQFLLDVRNGKFEYDFLMEKATSMEAGLEEKFNKSNLPYGCDMNQVDELFKKIINL